MYKCECGNENFHVNESYTWKAYIDEDGVLQCSNPNTVIDAVICTACGAEYSEEDFREVNFN